MLSSHSVQKSVHSASSVPPIAWRVRSRSPRNRSAPVYRSRSRNMIRINACRPDSATKFVIVGIADFPLRSCACACSKALPHASLAIRSTLLGA